MSVCNRDFNMAMDHSNQQISERHGWIWSILAMMIVLGSLGTHFALDTMNRSRFSKLVIKSVREEREHVMNVNEHLLMRGQLATDLCKLLKFPLQQSEFFISVDQFGIENGTFSPSSLGMPRQPKVTLEDAINVVKKFMVHFLTNKFPPYSSPVWKEMSAELQEKWTPHDVYTNVRENRRNILGISREQLAIQVSAEYEVPKPQEIDDSGLHDKAGCIGRTARDDSTSSDSDDSTWIPGDNQKGKDNIKKRNFVKYKEAESKEFELVLTEEEWNSIKPDGTVLYGKRNTEILRRGAWTNVISIAFWKQHKTRCAFVYKRANVKVGSDNDSYIVDIYGKCKSAACNNRFNGHGETQRDSKGLIIKVETRDTRSELHEEVKRPLNGERRQRVAQEMMPEACVVWKRRAARENMQEGDIEPSFLPNADVLRQAKKEGIHAKLNVKPGDARDLIRTVENICADPNYLDLVQAVGSKPFYVFYSTPAQLDVYKKYLQVKKTKSIISVDATGCLVRKLDRPEGTKTGHIFLYSIVVNFEGTTQPVHQMLSEKHDMDFIEYWLKQWLRIGAGKPKEAVSDYSRALVDALCFAFNNRSIKTYLDICFAIVENTRGVVERPSTIIRIDVAHFIHMICRWECFRNVSQSCIKDFFVRCVALMVETTTLNQFATIFTLTCAVGLQTHEDSELELQISHIKTAKDARHKLEDYIATRHIVEKIKKNTPRDDVDYTAGPFESEVPDDTNTLDDDTKSRNRLLKWVALQREQAKRIARKGRNPNAFYLPDFVQQLYKLAKEFPLWTGLVAHPGSPHATSSYVEAYFNDIKTRVFTSIKAPARVDIFIKVLARNIIGETLLFNSKLIKAQMIQAAEEEKTASVSQPEKTKKNGAEQEHFEDCEANMGQDERKQSKKTQTLLEQTKNTRPNKKQLEDFEVTMSQTERDQTQKTQKQPEQTKKAETNPKQLEDCGVNMSQAKLQQTKNSQTQQEQKKNTVTEQRPLEDCATTMEHAKGEETKVQPGSDQAEKTPVEMNVGELRRMDDSLQIKPYQDTDMPELKLTAGDLTCFENDSCFLGISSTDVTVNDSDLMASENWRGLAHVHKSVDDFSDIHPTVDSDLVAYVRISPVLIDSSENGESNENIHLEHIADTMYEELENCIGSAEQLNTHDCSVDDILDLDQSQLVENNENHPPSTGAKDNISIEIPKTQTKTSKYFKSYPEIRQTNQLIKKLMKPHVLPNGNRCRRGVQLDGNTVFVRNTCSFDSLVHILMTRGIDDLHYASLLKKSQNKTLQFVSALIKNSLTEHILRERANILKDFYSKVIAMQTEDRVLSYEIDAWDSIDNIVKLTMVSEPSVYKKEECSHCSGRTYSYATIAPNHNIISRSGFGALKSALAFRPIVQGLKCNDSCPGKFTLTSEPHEYHLFIDMDIREGLDDSRTKKMRERSQTGLKCKLEDMPRTIVLDVRVEGQRKRKAAAQYSLAGLVGYQTNHFVAYCRRYTGAWEVYDDTWDKVATCKSAIKIEPHLAVYIRQEENETY